MLNIISLYNKHPLNDNKNDYYDNMSYKNLLLKYKKIVSNFNNNEKKIIKLKEYIKKLENYNDELLIKYNSLLHK